MVAPLEEITQCFRYIMMKLGLRSQNWPSEIERALITQHLLLGYGGHTVEEVKLAFDMAILRKLDVDPNCYENFSCEYISKIMDAYRKWAAQEFREMPVPLPPSSPVKENLSNFAMLRWLAQEIRYIKTGKPFEFVPEELYDYLHKRGKIAVTNEEKFVYLQKAAAWRSGQLTNEVQKKNSIENLRNLENFRLMRENDSFTREEFEKLKKIAKKLLFFDLAQKTN